MVKPMEREMIGKGDYVRSLKNKKYIGYVTNFHDKIENPGSKKEIKIPGVFVRLYNDKLQWVAIVDLEIIAKVEK